MSSIKPNECYDEVDSRGLSGIRRWLDDSFFGIEILVGDQRVGLHRRQQVISIDQIMRFTSGQENVGGVASASPRAWILVLPPYAPALSFKPLTQTHRQEAALARWRDVNMEARTWTILHAGRDRGWDSEGGAVACRA